MDKLVLIGAGGHCRSVIDSVLSRDNYKDIVITDPDVTAGTIVHGCRVVGNDDMLPILFREGYKAAFISVGSIRDTACRRRLVKHAQDIGFVFPSIIDLSAIVAEDVIVSEGVFIGKNAVINANSKISEFSIINTGSIVEHDCMIGQFSHISVGAIVCGGVEIGNDVFIGANATVIQGIVIHDNTIIGAGSTILHDVPSNAVITGVYGGT